MLETLAGMLVGGTVGALVGLAALRVGAWWTPVCRPWATNPPSPKAATSGTAELAQAYCWTCDGCGRDNFERAVTLAPESIRPGDIPEDIQDWLDAGGEADWVMAPDRVRCRHCGASFAAVVA